MNHVDVDGSVQCAPCGLVQAFDVNPWEPLPSWAHEVADVAGPGAGGRVGNPSFVRLDTWASVEDAARSVDFC